MRRIEKRFYDKICIHGMTLDGIAEEIDRMGHRTLAQYQADGTMFTTPYKMAREIISNLTKRGLIESVNGRYKPRLNSKKCKRSL